MLPEFFQFSVPTKILYQQGITADIGNELEELGVTHPFIVTDHVVEGLGLLHPVEKAFEDAGVHAADVFQDVPENSEVEVVKNAALAAKEAGSDSVVAVGGGSVIDTAKGVNLLLSEGGNLVDYSGAQLLTRPLKPLVVVPTTAGTGSEVTSVAVIYNESEKVKMVFPDRYLTPDLAVLDPEMTSTMPPALTAATGMDALTHAIEAVTGIDHSPFSDSLALSAIRLIDRNIVNAVRQGDDLDARGAMCIAACLAGVAFTHSMVGCIHGMAHTLGGLYRIPHGIANSIMLPFGLQYNLPVAEDRIALLATALLAKSQLKGGRSLAEAVIERCFELQSELKESCGMPSRLGDLGLKERDLQAVAEGTVSDGTSIYNPREVEVEEILNTLKRAL
jgi:alcohol dehydrogenase class IV